jgi:hypothetical protein
MTSGQGITYTIETQVLGYILQTCQSLTATVYKYAHVHPDKQVSLSLCTDSCTLPFPSYLEGMKNIGGIA